MLITAFCTNIPGVQRQADFTQWLSQTVLASLYPGGPYERKYLAMLLLNTLLEVWNTPDSRTKTYTPPSCPSGGSATLACNAGTLVIGDHWFQAFCNGFFEAPTIHVLLGTPCLYGCLCSCWYSVLDSCLYDCLCTCLGSCLYSRFRVAATDQVPGTQAYVAATLAR